MNNVRPQMKMLTEEQIQDIHKYTLKLLATTGVRVDSPSAVTMLEKKSRQLKRRWKNRSDSCGISRVGDQVRSASN